VRSFCHRAGWSPGEREQRRGLVCGWDWGGVDPSVLRSAIGKESEIRKLILLMAITLDGVVAPANGREVFDHGDRWSAH